MSQEQYQPALTELEALKVCSSTTLNLHIFASTLQYTVKPVHCHACVLSLEHTDDNTQQFTAPTIREVWGMCSYLARSVHIEWPKDSAFNAVLPDVCIQTVAERQCFSWGTPIITSLSCSTLLT